MARQNPNFHHPFLEAAYEEVRVSPEILRLFTHDKMVALLQRMQAAAPDLLRLEVVGQSVEGRDLYLVKLGSGPTRILMWSQMHGDEPTATAALMDVFRFVIQRRTTSFVQELLQNSTLLVLPMLNPDGAERFTRRNAQGLDINRDARDLATPEGRTLKAVRDRYQPQFGFNLHDQNARRTVGRTNKQVAIALMAPPFDWEESDNPVRVRAKQVASVIYQALGPYLYGHMARYDAGYMPRAFGDSMQHWGTSTVLVEAGGWQERDKRYLVKMNFIALLSAWHAIATGSYAEANPALYDALPQNDQELFDLVIREALVVDGTGLPPFRTDVGINYIERAQGDSAIDYRGVIEDLGDMEVFAAKDTIEADGLVLLPGLIAIDPELRADDPGLEGRLKSYLLRGYTTVLGAVKIDWQGEDVVQEPALPAQLPVDFGLLASLNPNAELDLNSLFRLGSALRDGVLGILAPSSHPLHQQLSQLAAWVNRALIDPDSLTQPDLPPSLSAKWVQARTAVLATRLGLKDRGLVRPGRRADLVLFEQQGPPSQSGKVRLGKLRYVFINGEVVVRDGVLDNRPDSSTSYFVP
jgi:hypothetical protein